MLFQSQPGVALADVPRPKLRVSSGIFNTCRQIGFALGVAILTSVLVSTEAFKSHGVNAYKIAWWVSVGFALAGMISVLMRKLATYPRQNQVAKALTEFGKLERTAFLLEYFRDESLRRRILIGRE